MKCSSCSKGCELHIQNGHGSPVLVTGGSCHRGEAYALKVLDTENLNCNMALYRGHVKIEKAYMTYVLVTSDREIPKEYFSKIDDCLEKIVLAAPVEKNQVVYEEAENPEIRIIASRGMRRRR